MHPIWTLRKWGGWVLAASGCVLTACGGDQGPDARRVELTFATVSAGETHTCGVTTGGVAYCWGNDGGIGKLGDGTLTSSTIPVPVAGGLSFAMVSASALHTCGVTTDGAAYCWGDLPLGDGTSTSSNVPVQVAGGLMFATVSAGSNHTCGVTTSGAAYCWGWNHYGQLGDETFSPRQGPVPVAGGLTFATVSAGTLGTCGVTTDGVGYCWGTGQLGKIGDGTWNRSRPTPTAVEGGLTFASISAGEYRNCGVTTEGAAYCWGDRPLGDGTLSSSNVPVPVAGGLTFAMASAGGSRICGVTTGGAGYCWGDVPAPVVGGLTFATVSAGESHTCGVTTGGAAYCWGNNNGGQLGDGTFDDRPSPVPVARGLPSPR